MVRPCRSFVGTVFRRCDDNEAAHRDAKRDWEAEACSAQETWLRSIFKPKQTFSLIIGRRPASKMTKAGAISPGLQLATSG
jgi:hypothetical protein